MFSTSVAICVHCVVRAQATVAVATVSGRVVRFRPGVDRRECRLWLQQMSFFKVDDSDIWQTQQFLMSTVVYTQCALRTSAWCGEVLGLVGVVNAEIAVS